MKPLYTIGELHQQVQPDQDRSLSIKIDGTEMLPKRPNSAYMIEPTLAPALPSRALEKLSQDSVRIEQRLRIKDWKQRADPAAVAMVGDIEQFFDRLPDGMRATPKTVTLLARLGRDEPATSVMAPLSDLSAAGRAAESIDQARGNLNWVQGMIKQVRAFGPEDQKVVSSFIHGAMQANTDLMAHHGTVLVEGVRATINHMDEQTNKYHRALEPLVRSTFPEKHQAAAFEALKRPDSIVQNEQGQDRLQPLPERVPYAEGLTKELSVLNKPTFASGLFAHRGLRAEASADRCVQEAQQAWTQFDMDGTMRNQRALAKMSYCDMALDGHQAVEASAKAVRELSWYKDFSREFPKTIIDFPPRQSPNVFVRESELAAVFVRTSEAYLQANPGGLPSKDQLRATPVVQHLQESLSGNLSDMIGSHRLLKFHAETQPSRSASLAITLSQAVADSVRQSPLDHNNWQADAVLAGARTAILTNQVLAEDRTRMVAAR